MPLLDLVKQAADLYDLSPKQSDNVFRKLEKITDEILLYVAIESHLTEISITESSTYRKNLLGILKQVAFLKLFSLTEQQKKIAIDQIKLHWAPISSVKGLIFDYTAYNNKASAFYAAVITEISPATTLANDAKQDAKKSAPDNSPQALTGTAATVSAPHDSQPVTPPPLPLIPQLQSDLMNARKTWNHYLVAVRTQADSIDTALGEDKKNEEEATAAIQRLRQQKAQAQEKLIKDLNKQLNDYKAGIEKVLGADKKNDEEPIAAIQQLKQKIQALEESVKELNNQIKAHIIKNAELVAENAIYKDYQNPDARRERHRPNYINYAMNDCKLQEAYEDFNTAYNRVNANRNWTQDERNALNHTKNIVDGFWAKFQDFNRKKLFPADQKKEAQAIDCKATVDKVPERNKLKTPPSEAYSEDKALVKELLTSTLAVNFNTRTKKNYSEVKRARELISRSFLNSNKNHEREPEHVAEEFFTVIEIMINELDGMVASHAGKVGGFDGVNQEYWKKVTEEAKAGIKAEKNISQFSRDALFLRLPFLNRVLATTGSSQSVSATRPQEMPAGVNTLTKMKSS